MAMFTVSTLPVRSSPAVVDGRVYVGSYDGNVYCLNASTGAYIWSYATEGVMWPSPAVADGKVYVGSGDRKVYALNASTGAFIWNYTTGYPVFSSPAVAYDRVYVGSVDCNVYCLNASTGAYIWSYTTSDSVWSSPAVADGKVYVGSDDNNIYCLNALTGAHIWSYPTGGGISSPAVAYGRVYIGSLACKVYAFGPTHDVAITNVAPSKTVIGQGYELQIHVTVENQGSFPETFNVTIYADLETTIVGDEITIGMQDLTLTSENSTTLIFPWNTTGVIKGNYTITAKATQLPGEIDLIDNTITDGWVRITILGDANGNGEVDIYDKVLVGAAFGASYNATDGWYWHQPPDFTEPCIYCPHTPNADINCDGVIDIFDKVIVGVNFGSATTSL